jgi:uncharacterized DUF497 family protein
MIFYWDEWNLEHVAIHGVSREEAMFVVRRADAPYPEQAGGGKYRVWGRTPEGRLIQVVFAYASPERMDYEQLTCDDILELEGGRGPYVYIIHARELTTSEKRSFTKRRR